MAHTHRYSRLPDWKQLQRRFEVSAIVPTDSAVRLAHERTEGMVGYYLELVRRVDWRVALDYTERLAQSAYLQGVEDCAVAMAKLGYKLEEKVEGGDD